jgi:HTH-type transcriptional repressor of NAD biosynthesis genes
MTKAFVFGKFLPFHKGHEAMIHFALSKCDFLTVLVCCSDKETIPDFIRKSWIEQTFVQQKNIEIQIFNYAESELPNSSVSSRTISETWATVFKKLLPDCNLLITSEPYGDFVAEYMKIQHITFDLKRTQFPVSASAVRNDIFGNWQFLPDSVKPYFALKVAILGTESTGKTTLTEKLARYYNCGYVLEAARAIIPDSNSFTFDDLPVVATAHAQRITEAITGSSPLVIIDTDIHITISYAKFTFGQTLEVSPEIYEINKAGLYLYLNNDAVYMQDGTRLSENERNLLDISHREVLRSYEIDFVEITGNWDKRFQKAIQQIDKWVKDGS